MLSYQYIEAKNRELTWCSRAIYNRGDIRESQADISLAQKIIVYQPIVQFEEGLKRTWPGTVKAYTKS